MKQPPVFHFDNAACRPLNVFVKLEVGTQAELDRTLARLVKPHILRRVQSSTLQHIRALRGWRFLVLSALLGFLWPIVSIPMMWWMLSPSDERQVFGFVETEDGYTYCPPWTTLDVRESGVHVAAEEQINDWHVQIAPGKRMETVITLTDPRKQGDWNIASVSLWPIPETREKVAYLQFLGGWLGFENSTAIRVNSSTDPFKSTVHIDLNHDGRLDRMIERTGQDDTAEYVYLHDSLCEVTSGFRLQGMEISDSRGQSAYVDWSPLLGFVLTDDPDNLGLTTIGNWSLAQSRHRLQRDKVRLR